MSHFYAKCRGNRGEATRCGSKASGMTTYAAGWNGAIHTRVYHDDRSGQDRFEVALVPWQGSGGFSTPLASGVLSSDEWVGHKRCVETALTGIQMALKALDAV